MTFPSLLPLYRRNAAALSIQRLFRGHVGRAAAAQRREKLRKLAAYQCLNCGRVERGGAYCKGCGRRKPGPVAVVGVKRTEAVRPSPVPVNTPIQQGRFSPITQHVEGTSAGKDVSIRGAGQANVHMARDLDHPSVPHLSKKSTSSVTYKGRENQSSPSSHVVSQGPGHVNSPKSLSPKRAPSTSETPAVAHSTVVSKRPNAVAIRPQRPSQQDPGNSDVASNLRRGNAQESQGGAVRNERSPTRAITKDRPGNRARPGPVLSPSKSEVISGTQVKSPSKRKPTPNLLPVLVPTPPLAPAPLEFPPLRKHKHVAAILTQWSSSVTGDLKQEGSTNVVLPVGGAEVDYPSGGSYLSEYQRRRGKPVAKVSKNEIGTTSNLPSQLPPLPQLTSSSASAVKKSLGEEDLRKNHPSSMAMDRLGSNVASAPSRLTSNRARLDEVGAGNSSVTELPPLNQSLSKERMSGAGGVLLSSMAILESGSSGGEAGRKRRVVDRHQIVNKGRR